jgi:uncharacterized protein (DUF488 family)
MSRSKTIFTVGHSTRTFDEFVSLLHVHKVLSLADVRTVPRSRRVPQFNDDCLASALPPANVEYHSFKRLGGWRKAIQGSVNTGWRNTSFRGYADFMQTPAFEGAIEDLIALAQKKAMTMMCAEAVPWRCHRSLIADALTIRGWTVLDIMNEATANIHKLTPFANVEGMRITYPKEPDQAELFT